MLQRGIAIHKRLERLVLEEQGLDEVVRALAAATGGAVCVLSGRGETIAAARVPPAAARRGRGAGARGGAPARGAGAERTAPSSLPTTRRSAAARSCCPVSIRGARRAAGLAVRRARLRRARGLRATDPPAGRDRGGARADAPARDARHGAAPGRRRAGGGAHRAAVRGGAANAAAAVRRGRDTRRRSCSRATRTSVSWPRATSTASSPRPACRALVAPRERLLCAVVDAREGLDPVALAEQACEALDGEGGRLRAGGLARRARGGAPQQLPRGALRARGGGARQRPARGAWPPTATSARSS